MQSLESVNQIMYIVIIIHGAVETFHNAIEVLHGLKYFKFRVSQGFLTLKF